ncbi:MAG: leucine-rich repeat domain-containing protein [Paludibacteraceae bacterium]|nr:leucine-rich repeat domain-containing protein [Paludibacteraceae bacterium]
MRKTKLFSLFVALACATGLWATPELPKTWTYEKCEVTLEEDGTLYVDARYSSNVEMDATRDANNNYPWHEYEYSILVKKVEISDKITSIADYAFRRLTNLTEVELGAYVETIGHNAFAQTGLTSFSTYFANDHSHLKTIGQSAFAYCVNLSSLTLVEELYGLETIDMMAFNGCSALTEITIPATVTNIGARAFIGCTNVTDVYCNPTAKYLTWDDLGGGFDFKENKATILHVHPDQFDAYKKKFWSLNFTIQGDFPRGTFSNYESGTCYVSLADGTLTITPKNGIAGELASKEAGTAYKWQWKEYEYDILHIVVADGITNIPNTAFADLQIAEDIQIGKDVQTIGNGAFADCKRIKTFELPEGLTSIGDHAFWDCYALTSITFPASMRTFGFRMFDSCTGLNDVYCPVDATDFTVLNAQSAPDMTRANYLFALCKSSVNFHVHSDQLAAYQQIFADAAYVPGTTVNVVGDLVRSWTSKTCTVTLENGVLTVAPTNGVSGAMDLYDVSQVTPWYKYRANVNSIVVADGVTEIKDYDFGYMPATSLSLGNDLTKIYGSAFENCSQLTSVVIPAGVNYIGDDAFSGCDKLTSLSVLSVGSVVIRNNAFSGCGKLNTIDIKATTLDIKKGAFKSCDEVSDIYLYADAANVTWAEDDDLDDSFKTDDEDRTVCHVHADQLTAYQTKFPDINVTFVGDLDAEPQVVPDLSETMTAEEISDFITDHDGELMDIIIQREVYCNNYYNTLCLPFDMNAAQIAASTLNGAEIKAFTGAEVVDDVLHLSLTPVNSIEAGKPYFIKYSDAETLSILNFINVGVNQAEPEGVTFNGVTLQGTFAGFNMPAQTADSHSYLFLGQNNKLYWPNEAGRIKPFRAYFIVQTGSIHGAPHRGMPAVFEETDEATDVENVQNSAPQCIKRMENGQLIIIRNGVRCNAAGQIVK